jgi:hypothetical protein
MWIWRHATGADESSRTHRTPRSAPRLVANAIIYYNSAILSRLLRNGLRLRQRAQGPLTAEERDATLILIAYRHGLPNGGVTGGTFGQITASGKRGPGR